MSSDRARNSYDPQRMYRSVVLQQGRVTLEADANEAEQIRADARRAALLDVVGPAGSPDDGFAISVPATGVNAFDFLIGSGVMYVGGNRLENGDRVARYLGQRQTEWLDHPAGFLAPDPTNTAAFSEMVYLSIAEHEVTGVEDEALREVALGGPDTAARTRLVQRVQRIGVPRGTDCATAFAHLADELRKRALRFDPETMQLRSTGRLKVEFRPPPVPADDCKPEAAGGFLGPENQMIRVQIDADGRLLWGYDNASSLYRVTITDARTLELAGIPVDQHHQPQADQWVEVLDSAIELDTSAHVAASTGQARQVGSYDPSTRVMTLQTDLVAPVVGGGSRQVFVRVWQNRHPRPTSDSDTVELHDLDGASTGLLIRLSGEPAVGDHWTIGVRPNVPQQIFPERLTRFQRPDGPRRWVAPLAVVDWNDDLRTASITDCRPGFDNLVEITERGGCCELTVQPGDDVQAAIDRAIQQLLAGGLGGLHLRFAPGVFHLAKPLILAAAGPGSDARPDLTISGCGFGSLLDAQSNEVALFARGWGRVGVFDLAARTTVARPGNNTTPTSAVFPPAADDQYRHLGGTISMLGCSLIVVERVSLECGDGVGHRAASCLTVRNVADDPSDVRIASSRFAVGAGQTGVLVVNTARATIVDNVVDHRHDIAPDHKRWADERVRAHLSSQLEFEGDHDRSPGGGQVDLHLPVGGGARLRFLTDAGVAELWRTALADLDERRGSRARFASRPVALSDAQKKAAKRLIDSIIDQVTTDASGPLSRKEVEDFRAQLDEFIVRTATAGGQGVVLAGAVAGDVRISDNTIANVMAGVHVGLSVRGTHHSTKMKIRASRRPDRLLVDRVQIVGNTIAPRVPERTTGVHAGVFVGNVRHATIRDNRVHVDARTGTRRAEGIRMWGEFGPYLLIADNAITAAERGIHIRPLTGKPKLANWRVIGSLVSNTLDPFFVGPQITLASDNVW